MVWKVVKDAVWRMRGFYLMTSLLVGLLWMTAGSDGGISTATALAGSMAFTFIQGPFVGFTLYGQREFIYLPLSRRQLWRARLTVALIVPVTFMLVAKLFALASALVLPTGSTLTLGTVLLSSVYDLAYVGAGLGLLAWSGVGLRRPEIFGDRPVRAGLWIASVLIIAMGPGWPLLFSAALPTEWNQLSGAAWLPLAAGLVIAVGSFFRLPKLAHPGRRQQSGAPGRKSASVQRGPISPARGVARLMWPEIAVRLGLIVVLAPVYWFVAPRSGHPSAVLWGLVLIGLSASRSPETMGAQATLRLFRMLPISTHALSAILVIPPLLTCFCVWLVLAAPPMLFGVGMPALTTGMLYWLIGIASVANGIGLTLAGTRFVRWGPILPLMLGFFIVITGQVRVVPAVDLVAPFVALGGVAAAAWLTFRALRRNNSVYRRSTLLSMSADQGASG